MCSLRSLVMPANHHGWSRRFFDSIRGKIIILLRPETRTVADLAEALHLTDNAIRAQLAALEREGLVRRSGQRRGFRKPHYSYQLTTEGEKIFPRSYGMLLNRILTGLKKRFGSDEVTAVLRAVGRDLAASRQPRPNALLHERLEQVLRIF